MSKATRSVQARSIIHRILKRQSTTWMVIKRLIRCHHERKFIAYLSVHPDRNNLFSACASTNILRGESKWQMR